MTKIEELRAAYEAAMKPLPRWTEGDSKATHEFMEKQKLPTTLWETSYIWHWERLYRVAVSPIKVVKYDIVPGAKVPTVEFESSDGRRARGSVKMFYHSEDAAQAEADYVMAEQAKSEAEVNLAALMHNNLPALLDAVDALEHLLASFVDLRSGFPERELHEPADVTADRANDALEKFK